MKKLSIALSLAFLAAACAQPPTQEITDAQTAIASAIAAGAQDYATETIRTAQDTLTVANNQVDAKDYKAAKASALDAKAKAEAAQASVEAGKSQAKKAIETKIAGLKDLAKTTSAMAAKAKGKGLKEDAAALKGEVDALQTEASAGKYKSALDKSVSIESALTDLKSRIEASSKKAPAVKKGGKKK